MRYLILAFLLVGCYETSAPCVVDAGSPVDASVDPLIRDFRVTVLTPEIVLQAGTETSVLFRIERHPDFHEPILVTPCAIPDGIDWQARENREEDVDGIVSISLRASTDMEPVAPTVVCFTAESFGLTHTGRIGTVEIIGD